MGITKIHFDHCVGNMSPGTELPCIFCAGISPLQLGVVLVTINFQVKHFAAFVDHGEDDVYIFFDIYSQFP